MSGVAGRSGGGAAEREQLEQREQRKRRRTAAAGLDWVGLRLCAIVEHIAPTSAVAINLQHIPIFWGLEAPHVHQHFRTAGAARQLPLRASKFLTFGGQKVKNH